MGPLCWPPLNRTLPRPAVHEVAQEAARWLTSQGFEPPTLAYLSDVELLRCRALPQAIHGALFDRAEPRELFYGPGTDVIGRRILLAQKNAERSPSMLTTDSGSMSAR